MKQMARRGRPRDENAVRAPSGAKSRSRRARLIEALNSPTAQVRIEANRAVGMSAQDAVEAACNPKAATGIDRLFQLGVITAKHRRAARMLAAVLPVGRTRSQLSGLYYGAHIDRGGQLGANLNPGDVDVNADDAGDDATGGRYNDPADEGGSTFEHLMAEFLTHGLTPHVAATIARNAVIEEHGPDAWQLLFGILTGAPVPAKVSKALLRAALDTVSATLGTDLGCYIGIAAHEMHVCNRGPALLANELRTSKDLETELWLLSRGRRVELDRLANLDLRFLPTRPFIKPWPATAVQL